MDLVPSLTGKKWVDLEWTELRIINNLKNNQGNMVEVTVDTHNCQRYVWVDSKALEAADMKLDGLYLGVYTATPYPRPLGLLVETPNDVTFIPFYYPQGEYV